MSNIVNLHGGQTSIKAAEPVPPIIELLERLLADARAGKVQHIAAIWLDDQGVPSDAYAPGGVAHEICTLIGTMEVCKATITRQMMVPA